MAEPKIKPAKRVAGKSKFRLPERVPRPVEENPLRELLRDAKSQEEAVEPGILQVQDTPAMQSAGVSDIPAETFSAAPEPHGLGASVSKTTPFEESSAAYTFAEFSKRWSPILRSGQMGVCRALFELTYEQGLTECFTSMPKLAEAAGIKERQCYNVVAQLELLGLIERPEIFNTSTQKGTIFKLHMEPQPPSVRAARRYHIGGDEQE